MGRREYIYSYKHDFAFASWLLFGCIGFERNAGLLAPCNGNDLMHGHCDFWHPTCLQGWASASSATSNKCDAAMLDPRKQCRGYIDRKINI